MNSSIVTTLLELADATSHNLEFSHRPGVQISYGEETITETNLLELRRRHPERTRLEMFTKHKEAMNGADWEWHIVGHRFTLKMRVQAKRLQCNDVLRIKHRVGSTRNQQRDLLINQSLADSMKPLYCIYCTEHQRSRWKQAHAPSGLAPYHTGCLLADAFDVPLTTRTLPEIEQSCVPWHYLFYPSAYARLELLQPPIRDERQVHFLRSAREVRSVPLGAGDASGPALGARWDHPTILDLNDETGRDLDRVGVHPTTDEDRARVETDTPDADEVRRADRERLLERRIRRILAIDVRDP